MSTVSTMTSPAPTVAGGSDAPTAAAAAPAPRTRPRGQRYPLDSIRAIAALTVIFFHAYQNNWIDGVYPWSGLPHAAMMTSDLAVDLFFVISGFLLWIPVSRSLLAGVPQRPGRQLIMRRAVRLLPLYTLVLLIAWALANPVLPGNWQDLVAHLTMTQVYSDTYIFWTLGPSWTLAIEFHAFLAVALMLPLISRVTPYLATRGQRLAVAAGIPLVIGTIGISFLSYHMFVAHTPHTNWSIWFGPVAKMHLFAFGMLLAVLCAAGLRLGRAARRAILLTAAVAVVAGVLARAQMDQGMAELLHIPFGLLAAAVLGTIVLTRDDQPRWLMWGPTVWIGALSYSLYLVHEPILKALRSNGLLPAAGTTVGVLVTAALLIALAVVVARIVNALIEKPVMQAYDGLQRVPDRYAEVGSEPSYSRIGSDPSPA